MEAVVQDQDVEAVVQDPEFEAVVQDQEAEAAVQAQDNPAEGPGNPSTPVLIGMWLLLLLMDTVVVEKKGKKVRFVDMELQNLLTFATEHIHSG